MFIFKESIVYFSIDVIVIKVRKVVKFQIPEENRIFCW